MASTASGDVERMAHFTYIWKIESAPGQVSLTSPVFTVPSMEKTKWKLGMDILLSRKEYYMSGKIFLLVLRNEEDDGPESIEVDFELSFLDTSGSPLVRIPKWGSGQFRKTTRSEIYEIKDDALWDKRGGWIFPSNPLTIRCRLWRKGTEISRSELCFACTRFDKYRTSCVWAIKGFSSLKLGEERKRILNFGEQGCQQVILIFLLDNREDVIINLKTPNLKSPFRIWAEVALLNAEGVVCLLNREYKNKNTDTIFFYLSVFEKTKAAPLLSNDVLLLRCELGLYSNVPAWNRIDDYKLMDHPNSRMDQRQNRGTNFDEITGTAVCPFKDIVHTFKEEGTLSDVSLRAGTKSFPVHKLILSSRSPVFRAMFTEDMREKTSKCIDIPGMDADTLGRLLQYIYQDTLQVQELTWEKAVNLYEAADEYALLNLKEKCSNVLKSNICESSVCKILFIADLHQDENLKKSVQHFMQNNPEIMNSYIWKAFRKEHSELACETTEQIIFNMKYSRS